MKVARKLRNRKASDFIKKLWRSAPSYTFSIDYFSSEGAFTRPLRSAVVFDVYHDTKELSYGK